MLGIENEMRNMSDNLQGHSEETSLTLRSIEKNRLWCILIRLYFYKHIEIDISH